jgi:tRNA pseudouridine55 synthase
LLIDKPKGPGSTAVLGRVKFLLNAEKAGHTGTLDPLASGLLPLCFGEATKFAQDLLDADKSYRAWLRLGMTTESGDAEGRVMNTRPVTCEPSDIDQVLQRFLGEQQQIPPMHSALKHQGQPLYQLARKGQSVQRQARRVVIHALRRVSVVADCLVIDVTCSKGTYVRVLAEDIGEMLGCGAHLSDLRRTRVGDLAVEAAVTPELLELEALAARQARLLPTDRLVSTLPKMTLEPELARRFSLGQRIFLPDAPPAERLGVYGGIDVQLPTHFLGVAQIDAEGVLRPLRLMSAARS